MGIGLLSVTEGQRSELPLAGALVSRVEIAIPLRLQLPDPSVSIEIGCPFQLRADNLDLSLDPELVREMGPVLRIAMRHITSAVVDADSTLRIAFDDGSTIEVGSDPDFEAWVMSADDGSMLVCMPGGQLAIWGRTDNRMR